jgi:hypothetical protein
MNWSANSLPGKPAQSEGGPAMAEEAGVAGNERLTALAGAVLLVLIVAEVATIPNLDDLMSVHVFVGVLLAGPLAVKIASTGWRFLRYYTNNPAYRRKGPPSPLLRTLAPVLLILTLVLIGSGIGLLTAKPGTQDGIGHALVGIHHASFLLWVVLVGIHIFAYIGRVPGLIASDWRQHRAQSTLVPGRTLRLAVNLVALIAGVIAAVLLMPAFAAWTR